jgi:hypothetical protein
MMNPESQIEFDRIVATEPAALSDADKEFIRARRSYLSEEQKAVYAEVLAEVQESAPRPKLFPKRPQNPKRPPGRAELAGLSFLFLSLRRFMN